MTDSIAKYAKLYCIANDSSIAIKDQQLTAQLSASYNYNSIQKEALDNKTKAYRFLVMLFISIILLAIVIITGIYTLYQFRKKREEQIKRHEWEGEHRVVNSTCCKNFSLFSITLD